MSVDQKWTGWRGRLVLLLIIGAAVAGLVYLAATVRSWRELFILGGPALSAQIAAIIGALVLLGWRLWLRRASRRWYADTLTLVRPILAGVRREQAAPSQERTTRASDDSLTKAVDHAQMALLLLESGPRLEAAGEVQRLAELASVDGWEPSASLTRKVRALARAGKLGARLRGRVDVEIERPPSLS